MIFDSFFMGTSQKFPGAAKATRLKDGLFS